MIAARRKVRQSLQVGALPWRRNPSTRDLEVLLVSTLETGRWVIPKGWPWPDRSDPEAAAEEAREEAGVTGRTAAKSIGSFQYQKRRKKGVVNPVRVDVYLLEVVEELADWPEQEQRRRIWLSPQDAAERVLEPELKAIIAALKGR